MLRNTSSRNCWGLSERICVSDGAKQNSSELHNVLSELAIRLAPVLTPDAEKTKNSVSDPTPVPTSIAEHIMLLTTSVMNAADRVHDIVGRLEI